MNKIKHLLPVVCMAAGLGFSAVAIQAQPRAAPTASVTASATVSADAGALAPSLPAPTDRAAEPAVVASGESPDAKTPAAVVAVETPAGPGEFGKLAKQVYDAARDGQWGFAILLLILLLVGAIRWLVEKFDMGPLEWFASRWGGWTLVMVGSTAGAMTAAVGAGMTISIGVVGSAVFTGFAAAGGVEFFKDIKKGKAEAIASDASGE